MLRKFSLVVAILFALGLLAAYVAGGSRVAPLTVSVGSGPIALVQEAASVTVQTVAPTGSLGLILPVASTAGKTLIVTLGSGTVPTSTSMPTGWKSLGASFETTNAFFEVWIYPNNPGGIQSVSIAITQAANVVWHGHISEWSGFQSDWSNSTNPLLPKYPLDAAQGTITSTSGATLTGSTGSNAEPLNQKVEFSGDLVITGWMQSTAAPSTPTFTSPSGFTRLIDNGSTSLSQHMDVEYQVGPAVGNPVVVTLTSTSSSSSAAGSIWVFKAGAPALDVTSSLGHGSVALKMNTADFSLVYGGHYLLEDNSGGYLLEDGSGYYLLDNYVPQLGDPVTFTNPTWSGRVTSVNRRDITTRLTNYMQVDVEAINSSTAPGGTAPGDFSDQTSTEAAHYGLEDGSGAYLLEDGSGYYLLESTTFACKELSIRTSQNQDGTTSTYGSLITYETGYAAGQLIHITSGNLGAVAEPYMITNVTNTFYGASATGQPTPAYLIEFGDAYQTLQTAGGGVLTRTASTGTQQYGVAMPAGTLGYAQVTADQGTFTAETDLTGLSVTVTVGAGRRIRVSGKAGFDSSVGGDTVNCEIKESGTQLQSVSFAISANLHGGATPSVVLTPSAGVHTYNLAAVRANGTGNITMKASSTLPAYILVEDIGT